jgi:glutamate dehydrogenase
VRNLEAGGVLSRELEQLPSELEFNRRKEAGIGLTAPELAVVVANVKNRYKGILSALPLTGHSWARAILTPYFPAGLVATRNSLDHPLSNPILGTVLANEAVNRCGPIMLVELAEKYSVDESAVILAWAQAWSALNLAPLFNVLDEHALLESRELSKSIDARCRLLQRAMIEGVLSASGNPESAQTATNLAELTALFGDAEKVAPLLSKFVTESRAFPKACQTIEALIDMADFLFSSLTAPRSANLDLAVYLQIGLQLRQQSGIAQLEPVLMQTHVTPLRTHALNALRRAQQRLLELVLLKLPTNQISAAQLTSHINDVLTQMGIQVKSGNRNDMLSLESVVLDVWALSEAASAASVDCV